MRCSVLALLSALVLVAPAGRVLAQATPPQAAPASAARLGQLSPDEARRAERARQRAAQRAASRGAPHSATDTKTTAAEPDRAMVKTAERPASEETPKRHHTVRRATATADRDDDRGERSVTHHPRRSLDTDRRTGVASNRDHMPRVGDRVPDDVPLYDLPPRADPGPRTGFGIVLGFGHPYPEPEEAEVEAPPPRAMHRPRFDDVGGDDYGYR